MHPAGAALLELPSGVWGQVWKWWGRRHTYVKGNGLPVLRSWNYSQVWGAGVGLGKNGQGITLV